MSKTTQYDEQRDCPHGHMKGKCDTCELIEAEKTVTDNSAVIRALEKRGEELEAQLKAERAAVWKLIDESRQQQARIAELEAACEKAEYELDWHSDELRTLEAEDARLRDKALKIGKAFMADTPFDVYHGIDIHETASDYAEWDGRIGEILPIDYFEALVRCCKESTALLGVGDEQKG